MDVEQRVEFYRAAKSLLSHCGFEDEIGWQASRSPEAASPEEFLCEAAWVVINSGFREEVARRLFPALALCFCDWNAREIWQHREACRASALAMFGHTGKIDAIIRIAAVVAHDWEKFRIEVQQNPVERLRNLPFVGPVTAYHLAKNLGYDVAKADRHLVATAKRLGHECVQALCTEISEATGDPIRVVDLVLWRHAEQGQRRRG